MFKAVSVIFSSHPVRAVSALLLVFATGLSFSCSSSGSHLLLQSVCGAVSDCGPHHICVEWGPLQVAGAQVLRYTVGYGTIRMREHRHLAPSSELHVSDWAGTSHSLPGADGPERAMSVRVCTGDGMVG